MKKYIILFVISLILPVTVFADETCDNVTYDKYCKGNTCLQNLQKNYNTWQNTNNSGKQCIKVIAQIKNTTKTYLNGKNPEKDYKCNDGSIALSELKGTPISNPEEVTDCATEICYVPEIWQMDCGNISSNNQPDNGSSSQEPSVESESNLNNESNNGNNSNITDEENNTNEEGQITGTTETEDTGVETYFLVLVIMILIATLILQISKKKNLFKNI